MEKAEGVSRGNFARATVFVCRAKSDGILRRNCLYMTRLAIETPLARSPAGDKKKVGKKDLRKNSPIKVDDEG